jgi:acyl carrier protein
MSMSMSPDSAGTDQVIEIMRASCKRLVRRGPVTVVLPEPFDPSVELAAVGLDSLLGAELIAEIEDRLMIELPFSSLWRARTLGEFVEIVRAVGIL